MSVSIFEGVNPDFLITFETASSETFNSLALLWTILSTFSFACFLNSYISSYLFSLSSELTSSDEKEFKLTDLSKGLSNEIGSAPSFAIASFMFFLASSTLASKLSKIWLSGFCASNFWTSTGLLKDSKDFNKSSVFFE